MDRLRRAGIHPDLRTRPLTTVIEARRALEQAVLRARSEIWAMMPGYDPALPLLSPEARAIGADWGALLAQARRRGVALHLDLTRGTGPAQAAAPDGGAPFRIERRDHPGCDGWFARRLGCDLRHRACLAVFDRKTLFLGQVGPCADQAESRDLQLMMQGPIAGEAQTFLEQYNAWCAGTTEPTPPRRLLRTISVGRAGPAVALGPRSVAQEIETGIDMLARRAERLIYLETRGLSSVPVLKTLTLAALSRPELSLVLVIDAEALKTRATRTSLRQIARDFGERCLILSASERPANIVLFDDTAGILGSVALTPRDLRRDTGAAVFLRRGDDIAALRRVAMGRWLPPGASEGCFAPDTAVGCWRTAVAGDSGPLRMIGQDSLG